MALHALPLVLNAVRLGPGAGTALASLVWAALLAGRRAKVRTTLSAVLRAGGTRLTVVAGAVGTGDTIAVLRARVTSLTEIAGTVGATGVAVLRA